MHAPAPVAEQQLTDLGVKVEDQYREAAAQIDAKLQEQALKDYASHSTWEE